MKCVLSATIFCREIPGQKIDLDSNGWPQAGRNRALRAIRKSFAFMIAGDQHLATVIHQGVDEFGDAGYSFCVPSIVNHYPRYWQPTWPASAAIDGPLEGLGDYFDGLGNRITMVAHANPDAFQPPLKTMSKRVKQATGHGIVRFNKIKRTITVECWPRGADVTTPAGRQYPGWPITIAQEQNYGRKAAAWLPTVVCEGLETPVIQVTNEKTKEVVYTLRIRGTSWQPKVFESGTYSVGVGEPATGLWKVFRNLKAVPKSAAKKLKVKF